MGIGLKFALPLSLAITLLLGGLGWSVYTKTRQALYTSIDRAGVFAVTALAAPDWLNTDNKKRLKSLLDERTVDVVISATEDDGSESIVASANDASFELEQKTAPRTVDRVTITRGIMTTSSGEKIPVRWFFTTIQKPGASMSSLAEIRVYLSEEKIEDELSGLLNQIIIFSLFGIALGIGIAFLVASRITSPIKALLQDIRAVANGNLRHRTRARSSDEIGTLATAVDEMTQGLLEGQRLEEDLVSKEHQEQITQEIQERLFPTDLPELDRVVVDAAFEPAGDLSSDLFDFVELDEGRCGFILLSASGQGIPAAMVLAMARSVFRACAPHYDDPADALRRINALFSPDLRRGMYVTAIYAVHDPASQRLRVASAGHKLGAVYLDRDAGECSVVHPAGIAMGLDKGPVFDRSLEGTEIRLDAGDAVLLGTAGILELKLESGEALGEKRFLANAAKTLAEGGTIARRLAKRISGHLAEDPGPHDLTLVSLAVAPDDDAS
jgi:serine phosphatase RsbU (regulator of sigma subunit)